MYKIYIVNKEDKEDREEVGERTSLRSAEKFKRVMINQINSDYKVEVKKVN